MFLVTSGLLLEGAVSRAVDAVAGALTLHYRSVAVVSSAQWALAHLRAVESQLQHMHSTASMASLLQPNSGNQAEPLQQLKQQQQ